MEVIIVAIRMRRGKYEDFLPERMMPAEWAIVLSGDPVVSDGKSAFICFSAGVVKRMATYDDMVAQFGEMTDEIIAQLTNDINAVIVIARAAANYANNSGAEASKHAKEAEIAGNYATSVADDLIRRKNIGEFNGPPGPQGIPGIDGQDGVVTTIQGQFAFQVQNGHLILFYPDHTQAPDFSINANGHLVLEIQ